MHKTLKFFLITISLLTITLSYTGSYFTDKDTVQSTLISGTWKKQLAPLLITEVYYNAETGKQEWVEIYNTTDTTINFKNWRLSDNHGTAVFHSNVNIPSHSFAILAHDKSIKSEWGLSNDVNIIVSTGWKLKLSNTGDRVILKDPNTLEIDAMSYGSDNSIFNLPCLNVTKGHSLERFNLTMDTDTAADFVDNPNPTPGQPYSSP